LAGNFIEVKNNPQITYHSFKSIGLDVGYSDSKTALAILGMYSLYDNITNTNQDIIQVLFSKQWSRTSHEQMMNEILQLLQDYHVTEQDITKIYVNTSGVAALKTPR
jgi:hypothetical protein